MRQLLQIVYDGSVHGPIRPGVARFLATMEVLLAQHHNEMGQGWAVVLEKNEQDGPGMPFLCTIIGNVLLLVPEPTHNLVVWFKTKDPNGKKVDIEFNVAVEKKIFEKYEPGEPILINFLVSEDVGIISVEIA